LYAEEILFNADVEDVAFLVVGDPFGFVYILCLLLTVTGNSVSLRHCLSQFLPVCQCFGLPYSVH